MEAPGQLWVGLAAFLATWATPACSTVCYLGHVSYEEARILLDREPIEKVLETPAVSEAAKSKIRLVRQAKEFAVEIGLARSANYLTYVSLDRDWTSLALTAAPPDSLDPYLWRFPIVGRVPYQGFFDRERAKQAEKALQEEGYETYLREVLAFSTLGWFDDPILSPMLQMDDLDLVNTVIHETTHATIYLKGQADFDESLASFVGDEGSLVFLRKRFGRASAELGGACDLKADEQRFAAFVQELVNRLNQVFRSSLPRQEKLERKVRIYAEMRERLREERPLYRTGRFAGFADRSWNNAMLASMSGYHKNLDLFRSLYAREEYDMTKTVGALKRLAKDLRGDAFEALRTLLEREARPPAQSDGAPCEDFPKPDPADHASGARIDSTSRDS